MLFSDEQRLIRLRRGELLLDRLDLKIGAFDVEFVPVAHSVPESCALAIRTEAGLVGDLDVSVRDVASWVAPVPGGVGPMTRAMLLSNVVERAERLAGVR